MAPHIASEVYENYFGEDLIKITWPLVDTKNLKDESRYLNTDNIFSLNRIGYNDTIESGTSLTLGLDFEKKNKENNDTFLSSKIGTVFRDEINENLVLKSLETAQLKNWLDNTSKILETIIGENGKMISGGERQRIGIARTLYFNADLIVLNSNPLDEIKCLTKPEKHLNHVIKGGNICFSNQLS